LFAFNSARNNSKGKRNIVSVNNNTESIFKYFIPCTESSKCTSLDIGSARKKNTEENISDDTESIIKVVEYTSSLSPLFLPSMNSLIKEVSCPYR
jgi:hypothetical protein